MVPTDLGRSPLQRLVGPVSYDLGGIVFAMSTLLFSSSPRVPPAEWLASPAQQRTAGGTSQILCNVSPAAPPRAPRGYPVGTAPTNEPKQTGGLFRCAATFDELIAAAGADWAARHPAFPAALALELYGMWASWGETGALQCPEKCGEDVRYEVHTPSTARLLLVGRVFSALAGACQSGTEWAGF